MADDLIDETLNKLPILNAAVESGDVKRGEVFCSKIIHQRASHQSRFTWSPLYKKIMEFNGHSGEGKVFPRPLKSPFPCHQCHRKFDCPPAFLPIIVLNGSRTEWGNFHDLSCANTYLHWNMNDSNLASRVADLYEYAQDVYGFEGDHIGFAPHFSMRIEYGGCLTDEEFDKLSHTPGLRTFERMAPFIPTEVVIEWQCRIDEMEPEAKTPSVPKSACAFGTDKRPEDKRKSASASEALAKLLGYKPESAHHHHQWEVRGLRQPSLAEIEKRLLSLPKPEEKVGLYPVYYKRHGEGAPLPQELLDTSPKPSSTKGNSKNSKTKKQKVADSGNMGLNAMLVSTRKPVI